MMATLHSAAVQYAASTLLSVILLAWFGLV